MAEYIDDDGVIGTGDVEATLIPDVDVVVIEKEEESSITPIIRMMGMDNIAIDMDHNELMRIGQKCRENYETDENSLTEWRDTNDEAMKLAKQVRETKTFPWRNASNVKVPLIGQAAMNFNARAYPEVVQGDKVVKAKVIGEDPDEQKAKRADRISEHMSYQLLDEMPNWEGDTDKLLIMLPIVGTMFRKVGWDEVNLRPEVTLIMPDKLTINYHATSLYLEDCRRISEEIVLFKNDIVERERAGLWLEIRYSNVGADSDSGDEEPIEEDEQVFIQQLCYLDLDDDGYEEPYMVTFVKESGDVVRIVANYDEATVSINEETGEIVKIDPYPIYTDYHFIPAFDGGFYSTGFGSYLYPINQTVDTIINQLIDAGTLSNVQGGFLGKGMRGKMGSTPLQPGEWRPIETKGADLKNSIVPLPAKEPSGTLFQLLVMLIDMGKEMSSITDVLAGVPQGQNTPVGTTLAMIEQGMKVIDAVYKRIYRALKEEYKMLYRINSIYLEDGVYSNVLDDPEASAETDYAFGDFDIVPVGDTRISSQVMRTMKAQGALDVVVQTGGDVRYAGQQLLASMDIDDVEKYYPETPAPEMLMQQIEELKGYGQAMSQQVQQLQQQLMGAEEMRKNQEAINKADESRSKTAMNMSSTAKNLSDAEKTQQEIGYTEDEALNILETAAASKATAG